MDDDAAPQAEEAGGAPAWVMTFADLMSLLMCFFVLLLSFSEMDVQKFKQLAGSMRNVFGVQSDIPAYQIPKGTSIVAKEFSPSIPQPTLLKKIRQDTAKKDDKKLAKSKGGGEDRQKKRQKKTEADTRKIAKLLEKEIKAGNIELETEDKKIIIRLLEKGAFKSGLAEITPEFISVMGKVKEAIRITDGVVKVSGHTDNIPIQTVRFRSNWELSAARAASVVHFLDDDVSLKGKTFEVIGYADTKPRLPNDSPKNRSKNRRVDIVILQGGDEEASEPDKPAETSTVAEGSAISEEPVASSVEIPVEQEGVESNPKQEVSPE